MFVLLGGQYVHASSGWRRRLQAGRCPTISGFVEEEQESGRRLWPNSPHRKWYVLWFLVFILYSVRFSSNYVLSYVYEVMNWNIQVDRL